MTYKDASAGGLLKESAVWVVKYRANGGLMRGRAIGKESVAKGLLKRRDGVANPSDSATDPRSCTPVTRRSLDQDVVRGGMIARPRSAAPSRRFSRPFATLSFSTRSTPASAAHWRGT